MLTYKHDMRNPETGNRTIAFYTPVLCDYFSQRKIAVLPEPVFTVLFAPDEYGRSFDYKVTREGIATITQEPVALQRAVYLLTSYRYDSIEQLEEAQPDWVALRDVIDAEDA